MAPTDPPAIWSKNRLVKSLAPPSPFEFEPGDARIRIKFKNKDIVALVSSASMSNASKVWKNFLFPPWEVIKPDGAAEDDKKGDLKLKIPEMDCREDDAEALLMLLNIAHLKFTLVPEELSTPFLYEVAILCDKYDCVELVGPWLKSWLVDEYNACVGEGYPMWIFISWVFGRGVPFLYSCREILVSLQRDKDGNFVLWGTEVLPRILPPGTLEHLIAIRKRTTTRLLHIPHHAWVRRLIARTHDGVPKCAVGSHTGKQCDEFVEQQIFSGVKRYEALWQAFLQHYSSVFVGRRSSGGKHPATNLHQLAIDIRKISLQPYHPSGIEQDHTKCLPDLFEEVGRVYFASGPPPLPSHQFHGLTQLRRLENKAGPITWEP